jgi:hypothetical protein
MPEDHDERDGFDEAGDLDDLEDLDDLDEFDDEDGPGDPWPVFGSPPAGGLPPAPGWRPAGGHPGRRGWLLALTAVVAAACGFGAVLFALHGATGSPAAAGVAPSATAAPSSGAGGGVPSLPPGAMERLEIGGSVTAVSATSITLDGGGQLITAAVTRSTVITGKVASIRGIKVGDLVSASITGANGKLTAESIQDPASLPSGPGQ